MKKEILNLTLYHQIEQYRESKVTALYFRNHKVSFQKLIEKVDILADKLYYLGVRENDVVTLLAPNIIETVTSIYALNKIGAIVSILHPLSSPNDLATSLKETKSKFLLIVDARYYFYKEVIDKEDVKVYFISARDDLSIIEKIGFHFLFRKENYFVDKSRLLCNIKYKKIQFNTNINSLKPSFYIQSGGTTGKSKTVILNDKCISFPGSKSSQILGREIKGISMIGLLPFYHGFGISMGLHAPLMNEAASSLMIKYNINEITRKIRKNELNVLIVIPYLARKLLNEKKFKGFKLNNLYATYVGADKTDPKLIEEFNAKMEKYGSENRLLQGYGLSESTAVNFVNTNINSKEGSVGKPLEDVKVIITHLDSLEKCKEGEVGRILISSPSICLGYLNSDNKELFTEINKDKYLVTGDLGYLDKDGYLFIQGRNVDVIKIAGYNVFPVEIEQVANKVEGVINSCAIFSNNQKHPYITLFVETKNKERRLIDNIYKHFKDYLLHYSIPEKIILVDKLPLTKLGKIDKNKIKEEYHL